MPLRSPLNPPRSFRALLQPLPVRLLLRPPLTLSQTTPTLLRSPPTMKVRLTFLLPTSTLTPRCLLLTLPRCPPPAFPLMLPSSSLTLLRLRLMLRSSLNLLRPILTLSRYLLLRLMPRPLLTRSRMLLTRFPSPPTRKLCLRLLPPTSTLTLRCLLLLPTTLRACSSHCYVACNRALPGRRRTVDTEVSVGVARGIATAYAAVGHRLEQRKWSMKPEHETRRKIMHEMDVASERTWKAL
jgi:hypothetical protein